MTVTSKTENSCGTNFERIRKHSNKVFEKESLLEN